MIAQATSGRLDPAVEAGYWQELKLAWARLSEGSSRLELGAEAEGYFMGLTHRYFAKVLAGDRPLARLRLAAPPAEEAWAVVFRELHVRRSRSGVRVFDDLFLRAFESARRHGQGGGLVDLLGFLKKQFELRLRDVARSWVREQVGGLGKATWVPLDAPTGDDGRQADGGGRSGGLHERMADTEAQADDPEWRDLERCGTQLGRRLFDDLAPLARSCVLLNAAHVSLAHPLVVATLGKGKSVLFDLERRTREQLLDACHRFDAGLDREGEMALAVAAYRELREACQEWFSSEMRDGPLFALVMEHTSPTERATRDEPEPPNARS